MSKQQEQTKSFLKKLLMTGKKRESKGYAIIKDRHRAVFKTLDLYPKASSLLANIYQ